MSAQRRPIIPQIATRETEMNNYEEVSPPTFNPTCDHWFDTICFNNPRCATRPALDNNRQAYHFRLAVFNNNPY